MARGTNQRAGSGCASRSFLVPVARSGSGPEAALPSCGDRLGHLPCAAPFRQSPVTGWTSCLGRCVIPLPMAWPALRFSHWECQSSFDIPSCPVTEPPTPRSRQPRDQRQACSAAWTSRRAFSCEGPACGQQTPVSPGKCVVSNPEEGDRATVFFTVLREDAAISRPGRGPPSGPLATDPYKPHGSGRCLNPHPRGAWDVALASRRGTPGSPV